MRNIFFLLSFLLAAQIAFAQTGGVRGTITDVNGEPLPGATIIVESNGAGASANEVGIYSINDIPAGKQTLVISYIGYDTVFQDVQIVAGKMQVQSFTLNDEGTTLEEIEILDSYLGKIDKKNVSIGINKITTKEIQMIPSFGVSDPAQYLTTQPGIISTGDQGGKIYVRGGTPIQNMVLLDNAVIYSPFHSIGVFSVFDTDYLRKIDLYTAGFGAEYGGRVSSVMDIQTRNGDFYDFGGKVTISGIASSLVLEGPIVKRTEGSGGASFLVSARSSYLDQTSKSIYSYVNDSVGLPYNFFDVYGKISITDGTNKFNLTGFRHTDNVNYEFPSDIEWNSYGGSMDFMFLPSSSNAIISGNFAYSKYHSGLKTESESIPRKSDISGFNGRLNFAYIINSIDEAAYGMQIYGFRTDYLFTNFLGVQTQSISNNTEFAAYFKYKKVIQTKRTLEGKQITNELMVLEPGIRAHYYNDQSKVSIEPRFRAKINLPKFSLNFATGLYSQNILSSQSDRDIVNLFQGYLSAPDKVEGNDNNDNLQYAIHYLAGVEVELLKNLETKAEFWMKDFTQLPNINRDKLFPEDPDFIIETSKAYGFDLSLKYEKKSLYLYGAYSLAKIDRTYNGETYAASFDRRHTINFIGSYSIGNIFDQKDVKPSLKRHVKTTGKWEFSVRWTLGSPFPFTRTQGLFEKLLFTQNGSQTNINNQNGIISILYEDPINQGRMSYFHRLDLAVKRRFLISSNLVIEANFSLINAYNRENIFYVDRLTQDRINQLPLIPSLGISAKF